MKQFQFQDQFSYKNHISHYDDESNINYLIHPPINQTCKQIHEGSTTNHIDHSDNSIEPESPLNLDAEADDYLFALKLRHYPSFFQEEFIHNFLSHESILRLKLNLTEEIVNEKETKQFEEWVQSLHNQNSQKLARELKVKKYLEKKRKRTYEKKVHYQVRQKVAGERMRIKGRFITWRQAVRLLDGDESKKEWTYNDYFRIKALLYEKYNIAHNL